MVIDLIFTYLLFISISATPILGGIKRKETMHALERRRANILTDSERKGMQTLGANNEFVRSRKRSTLDSKSRRPAMPNMSNNGMINQAFDNLSSDDDLPSENMNMYGGIRKGYNGSVSSTHHQQSQM